MTLPENLIAAARDARANAYAPYSRFLVGAVVELRDGRLFAGVNVENCSYPLSVCAERNAMAAAVLGGARPGDVVAVGVVADASGPLSPCGGCRQVLVEFAQPTAPVHLHNLRTGTTATVTLESLLPQAFTPASLSQS